jgi:predicted neutral ceramidase superfamily lipid hydrolase
MAAAGIIGVLIYIIFVLVFFGLWIYGFVLFVKLANRGIKALDIYLNGKTKKESSDHFID